MELRRAMKKMRRRKNFSQGEGGKSTIALWTTSGEEPTCSTRDQDLSGSATL
jgi:hypothetical protein